MRISTRPKPRCVVPRQAPSADADLALRTTWPGEQRKELGCEMRVFDHRRGVDIETCHPFEVGRRPRRFVGTLKDLEATAAALGAVGHEDETEIRPPLCRLEEVGRFTA